MKTTLLYEKYTASINHLGAELTSFLKGEINYIWTIDERYWNKTSPILFPIVGSLKNNSYNLNKEAYTLQRHGFARNFEFKVLKKTENTVVFSMVQNTETFQVYPFEFELQLTYVLLKNKLTISYTVVNNSNLKMPFNIGAHPAFSIPKNFENYSLSFNNEEQLVTHHLEHELFNGTTSNIYIEQGKLPLTYALFEKDALVFKQLKSNEISILKKDQPHVKVNFEGFPFLGVWTKKNAAFLCIEPWLGYADSLTSTGNIYEKEAIQILNSKESFTCSFSIEIY